MYALIGHLHKQDALAVVHLEIIKRQQVVQCNHLVLVFCLCLGKESVGSYRTSGAY